MEAYRALGWRGGDRPSAVPGRRRGSLGGRCRGVRPPAGRVPRAHRLGAGSRSTPARGAHMRSADTRSAHSCMAVRDAFVRVTPMCGALVRGAYTHGGYTRIVVRDALIRARDAHTRIAHTRTIVGAGASRE